MKVTGVFSWKYILKLLKAVLRSEFIHSSLALFLFFFRSRCSFLVHLGLALQNIDFGCSDITCTCKWSFFLCSVFSYSSFLFFFWWRHFYLVHPFLSSFSSSQLFLGRNPFLLLFLHISCDSTRISVEFYLKFASFPRTWVFFWGCLLSHFEFGSLPPELIACVLVIWVLLTYKILSLPQRRRPSWG